mmetsp:Transcript_56780/g.161177  ORF Transcript_56780/g.161177 Transcript_56780/m.161177 type:complete len:297 (+) Transcript_56780:659-1549(+)
MQTLTSLWHGSALCGPVAVVWQLQREGHGARKRRGADVLVGTDVELEALPEEALKQAGRGVDELLRRGRPLGRRAGRGVPEQNLAQGEADAAAEAPALPALKGNSCVRELAQDVGAVDDQAAHHVGGVGEVGSSGLKRMQRGPLEALLHVRVELHDSPHSVHYPAHRLADLGADRRRANAEVRKALDRGHHRGRRLVGSVRRVAKLRDDAAQLLFGHALPVKEGLGDPGHNQDAALRKVRVPRRGEAVAGRGCGCNGGRQQHQRGQTTVKSRHRPSGVQVGRVSRPGRHCRSSWRS